MCEKPAREERLPFRGDDAEFYRIHSPRHLVPCLGDRAATSSGYEAYISGIRQPRHCKDGRQRAIPALSVRSDSREPDLGTHGCLWPGQDIQDGYVVAKSGDRPNLFRSLLYRRMLGEDLNNIWNMLGKIHNQPQTMKTNAMIAARLIKERGLVLA